jgi:hypothetical protein
MDNRLAIIVPYRDRRKQLDVFIPHMDSFFQNKGIDYQIIVAEQRDDRPFNRGKLCNAVFDLIKDDFDYFCFHDVDLLPLTDDCDYSYVDKPTHVAAIIDDVYLPYEEFIGGVFLINKEHFEQINGFSDEYWGWGYEDNDLLERMRKNDIPLNTVIDISSVSKNPRYSFDQVYLHNNFKTKILNTIKLHGDICIEVPTSDSIDNLTNGSFSFSIWAKPTIEDYEQFILSRPPIGLGMLYTVEGEFKFLLWDENDEAHVIKDYRIPNEWYHLCMTYDTKTKMFSAYINGSLIKTIKVESLKNFSGEWFYIGADSSNENNFRGSVSEATLWNVCLSQDDVRTLYINKVEDLIYDPILFYRYDKGYGTFILDETTNEHNAIFKTNFKEPPLSSEHMPLDLPFGSTERIAVIGSRVKTVGKKFVNQTKGKITLGHPIKIPNRRYGIYKTLVNDKTWKRGRQVTDKDYVHSRVRHYKSTDGKDIVTKLKSYDPDILENSDIFFDEVREGSVINVGLNKLDYKVRNRQEFEDIHEWIEIIT